MALERAASGKVVLVKRSGGQDVTEETLSSTLLFVCLVCMDVVSGRERRKIEGERNNVVITEQRTGKEERPE